MLSFQEINQLFQSFGLSGTEAQFRNLALACQDDVSAMRAVASAILKFCNGDIAAYDTISVLEDVIQTLLQQGQVSLADSIYRQAKNYFPKADGQYANLGRKKGQFQKGLDLIALFDQVEKDKSGSYAETAFSFDRALYLIEIGKLAEAEDILTQWVKTYQTHELNGVSDWLDTFSVYLNRCDILRLTGRLSEADELANRVVQAFESKDLIIRREICELGSSLHSVLGMREQVGTFRFTSGINPYAHRAVARGLRGQVDQALADFCQAERFQQQKLEKFYPLQAFYKEIRSYKKRGQEFPQALGSQILDSKVTKPLVGQAAVYYAMLLTRLGKLKTAHAILAYNYQWAAHPDQHFEGMTAFCGVALGDVYRLLGELDQAMDHYQVSLAWADERGQKEIACWANLGLARLHLQQENLDSAVAAVNTAFTIAKAYRFQLYEIEAMLTAGRIALIREAWQELSQISEKAMGKASNPDCGYAWAQGSALHLLAETYFHPDSSWTYPTGRQEKVEMALRLVQGAIQVRERIRDPRLANSQELLMKITAQGA